MEGHQGGEPLIWDTLGATIDALAGNPKDPDAWEHLYRRLYPYLFSIYFRTFHGNRGQAEEASHETVVRLYQKFDFGRSEAAKQLPAYLARIIETIVADQRRLAARPGPVSLDEIDPAAEKGDSPDWWTNLETHEELRARLSGDELQMVELLAEGFVAAEIAAKLGISVDAAYQRISRLRKRLRGS